MSKHHHHPNEGHDAGEPPGSGGKPLHHNVFFWVAGFFILIALIGFVLEGVPAVRATLWPPQPAAATAVGK